MFLLPQKLYIFHTLPIPLKNTYLKSLNSLLRQYIWGPRRPRCSKALLIKHRSVGGMGLINIKDYYWASMLTQLKHWISPSPDILWSSLEQDLSPTRDLRNLLLLDIWKPYSLRLLPLSIQASLIAWRDLHKLTPLPTNNVDIPISVEILNHVIPHTNYLDWLAKGISQIADLYVDNTLKPFDVLAKEYTLSPTDFYKYIQLSHFLKSLKSHCIRIQDIVWQFYTKTPITPKGISLFCNLFQNKVTFTKPPPFKKWELDLEESFSKAQWQSTLRTVYKISRCVNHWELSLDV